MLFRCLREGGADGGGFVPTFTYYVLMVDDGAPKARLRNEPQLQH